MESPANGAHRRRAVLYRGLISPPLLETDALSPFFNYGRGFFETLLYEGGKLRFHKSHMDRIRRTSEDFGFRIDYSEIEEDKILTLLKRENLIEHCSRVKILYAPVRDASRWDTVVTAAPYTRPLQPFALSVHDEVRDTALNRYKSLNYGYNLHWKEHYRKQDRSDEVLFINRRGLILEGSFTNILYIKGTTLFFVGEKQNCLRGIMQDRIVEAAFSLGLKTAAREEGIALSELKDADEVMVSNSLMRAKSVRKILRGREVLRSDSQSGSKSMAEAISSLIAGQETF